MRHVPAAIACLLLAGAPAGAQIARLGAMGDSLSDEYAEETYSYARNWTMLLVQRRGVPMGPTAAQAQQPGGTWGEPRRTMYESDWARYGDGSADLLARGQHTGLAGQVPALGVSHAVLMIGANDFYPFALGPYFSIYNNFWSQAQITSYVNGRIANMRAALDVVAPTGVRLVVVNVLDFGIAPITQSIYGDPVRRDRVTAVIQQVNAGLLALAQEKQAVLVDAFALTKTVWGPNTSLNTTLLIGNTPIQLRQADTTGNTNPAAAFVHDSAHPHTAPQGVLANLILHAFNEGYRAGTPLFTEQEILEAAGLPYGGQDTLGAAIGPWGAYIRNFACYPNCDRSQAAPMLNVADFSCFLSEYAAGRSYANCDQSTTPPVLNVADFSCFLGRYAAGCP